MIHKINGETLVYAVDDAGHSVSFYNKQTCHEYIFEPGPIWKIIYASHKNERVEIPVYAEHQKAEISVSDTGINMYYKELIDEEGNRIDADLRIRFLMTDQGLKVTQEMNNHDASVQLTELQVTPVSGARALSGNSEDDYLAWPKDLGRKFRNPAYADLSVYSGFRKYERHDQFHTDMDALYQDGTASMQWYDWYNEKEGLYCASEDTTRQALGLHVERDVKLNVLRFGFVRYPMLEQGENWSGQAMDFFPHTGDWHTGSKFYRAWMFKTGEFTAPKRPEWCQDFTGWLRVILKQHHCELNWDYSDIPALYDEAEKAGFKTLYIMGWEKNGFARMWPDYKPDDRMGGEKKLKEGIEYVHRKGGKVLMFLSYALIDHKSHFYLNEGGDQATIKSIWNEDIPFAETYCGEGTYRKIANPAMPMYLACPGAPIWQEKMKLSAKVCLDLGADGVLYDIGAWKPYFCYAKNHTHSKPSHSHEHKAENYAELRKYVKTFGEDKIIMMEHNVDIYGKSMDFAQGSNSLPDARLMDPVRAADTDAAKDDHMMLELYRYTFPELEMTNRECGEDELHYKAKAGYSFLYGLRFDMTIYRCCGSFKDIPNYTQYLTKLNAYYMQFADYILRGQFADTDGFTNSNEAVYVKGWRGKTGGFAVTLWNPTGTDQSTILQYGNEPPVRVNIAAEEAMAMLLKK